MSKKKAKVAGKGRGVRPEKKLKSGQKLADRCALFDIQEAKDGQFYVVMRGLNRGVLLDSETYPDKRSAEKVIRAALAALANGYVIRDFTSGE